MNAFGSRIYCFVGDGRESRHTAHVQDIAAGLFEQVRDQEPCKQGSASYIQLDNIIGRRIQGGNMTVSSITRPIDMVGSVIDVVDSTPDVLGESIIWDEKTQLLWWVDGIGQAIHRPRISSGAKEELAGCRRKSAASVCGAKGGLIASAALGLLLLLARDRRTDRNCPSRCGAPEEPLQRRQDRPPRPLLVRHGSRGGAAYTLREGRLFRLDPDLKPHLIMEVVTCINGISFPKLRPNGLMGCDRAFLSVARS